MLSDLVASFLIGFVGSAHCLGMCGPLVLAYSLHLKKGEKGPASSSPWFRRGIGHHLAFHAGRLTTYGFLGALAAVIFFVANLDRLFADIRGSMTLLGGAIMVGIGVALLRVVPFPQVFSKVFSSSGSYGNRWISPLFSSKGFISKILLGLATGFLPCGLSWAMIAKAATTQNAIHGFLIMVLFGIGTVPALFMTGISATLLSLKMRIMGERVAAGAVVVMGIILISKGLKIFI